MSTVSSAVYTSNVTVIEKITANVPAVNTSRDKITLDQFNTSVTLNSGTTPAVQKTVSVTVALSSGTATLDLTALTGANGSVDLTGLKIVVFKVIAGGSANAVTLTEGASNGYELGGNAWKMAVKNTQEMTFYGDNYAPAVGSGAKTIDLSGTGTDTVDIIIVAG